MTRVVLIGFTGAGKTTVGALLARRLGCPHLDVDAALEARLGPLPAYIAEHGLMEFRTAERAVIRESLRREPGPLSQPGARPAGQPGARPAGAGAVVVSAGAGSVLPVPTRRLLCRGAQVFFLDVPAPVLAARLAALPPDRVHRPDLLEGDAEAAIGAGLEARRGLYEKLGMRIDGTGTPEAVVAAVLRALDRADAGARV